MLVLGLCGVAAVAPILCVDHPVYAVAVRPGSLIAHSSVLTNVDNEPLSISDVCAPSMHDHDAGQERARSGEFVGVEATVDTTGFRGTMTHLISGALARGAASLSRP